MAKKLLGFLFFFVLIAISDNNHSRDINSGTDNFGAAKAAGIFFLHSYLLIKKYIKHC
jgi:isoprenylcysteine carboxyl methyltransferase (ICMT) family protein YpbQ